MKTESAQAAAAIRKELKAAFPSVKFSVRSRNFSMGDAVDVEWVDGPKNDAVEAIINKYQYGRFNGMEDIYEMTNTRQDIPQAKYVHAQRTFSQERKEAARQDVSTTWVNIDQRDIDIYTYRQLRQTSF